jgi:hypothetical protein
MHAGKGTKQGKRSRSRDSEEDYDMRYVLEKLSAQAIQARNLENRVEQLVFYGTFLVP